MTDNIVNINNETASSADTFRAELNKLHASMNEDAPEPVASEMPEDVAEAVGNAPIEMDEDGPQETPVDVSVDDEPEVETKGHLIPKSRFNQEIEKRKSLEEQLSREREERIKAETQYQMLNSMQQSQLQKQIEPSTVEDIDPLDTDTYNYAKREIESLKLQLASVSQETQARTIEMQMYNTITNQEAAFTKQHPDFNDAMKHVQDVEFNIAKDLLGDERAASEYVGAKLRDALTRSLNSGKNAAETIYNMAKTYGYSATKTQSKAVPTKNVEAIERNQQRSANTSNLGNSSGYGVVPSDIKAAMDDRGRIDADKFRKMLDRHNNA